jgi:CBS domain-containing protein
VNIKALQAAQLMTKDFATVDGNATLREAAALMIQRHVHSLLVLPREPERCVGVVAIKDIVQVLCDGEAALLDTLTVFDAVTMPAVSVQKDFLISDCLRLMRMSGVRSVPVLDGVRPVGLLSFTDVVRAAVVPDVSPPRP